MNRLFLVMVLQLPIFLLAQTRLEFIDENIDFVINKRVFSINGIYSFSNTTGNEIRQTILFPFSNKADSLNVKRVYNLTDKVKVPFQNITNGIVFKLIVSSMDTVNINISYCQKVNQKNSSRLCLGVKRKV
jgi:hypothetical protein